MMDTKTKQSNKGVTTPYEFTQEEFLAEIKKAEEGKFIPVEELKKQMDKWMESQRKRL